jgi:hypothetical protein
MNHAVTVLINLILVSIKHEADVVEDFKMYSTLFVLHTMLLTSGVKTK